jgi:hypothetical protein
MFLVGYVFFGRGLGHKTQIGNGSGYYMPERVGGY